MARSLQMSYQYKDEDVAVIGMSGRFPEADNLEEFWSNLVSGRDSVREFPKSRQCELEKIVGVLPKIDFLRHGYLDQITQFEPEIFSIHREESKYLDPQQRLLLELVEEAILDAGYNPEVFAEKEVGVFVAESENAYLKYLDSDSFMSFINRLQSSSSGRIAYTYNFCGPAFTIGSACSSTLTALHVACQSLKLGEAEYAITGGTRIEVLPKDKRSAEEIPIISVDQKAKTFDQDANGTILGEGGGILILKLVKKALADGDYVHAIIKGSALNNDGNRSSSFNAPSEEGQSDVIIKAIKNAKIEPKTIGYIEAHGTGTKIGDPIEINGITHALKRYSIFKQSIPIGSVKPNIGHLDTAAGIANVIKVILCLKQQAIPPTIHFKTGNPLIEFENSPVYVNSKFMKWEKGTVRRAGLTSLGLTGTNGHVILEEAPKIEQSKDKKNLITLSARTEKSLLAMIRKLQYYLHSCLENNKNLSITDVGYTLNTGRRTFNHRMIVEANSINDLLNKLESNDYTLYQTLSIEEDNNLISPILIIPDFQNTVVEKFRELAEKSLEFRKHLDKSKAQIKEKELLIDRRIQYVIFSYAYVKFLTTYSIQPVAALGFGIGDLIADVILGDISWDDCIAKILKHDLSEQKIEGERLKNLLTQIMDDGFNSFLLLMPPSSFVKIFTQVMPKGAQKYIFDHNPLQPILQLIQHGLNVDWEKVYSKQSKRRLSLPGYVFDRQSYFLTVDSSAFSESLTPKEDSTINPTLTSRGDISRKILNLLNDLNFVEEIDLSVDVSSLDLDSIAMIHITGKIKQRFNTNIPLTLFFQNLTLGEVIEKISDLIIKESRVNFDIEKQEEQEWYPTSPSQKMLYKVAQLDPSVGHIFRAEIINGNFDQEKFSQALKQLVHRHEALRTSFEVVDGDLVQIVHKDLELKVQYLDIRDRDLAKIIPNLVRPFDLGKAPLFRATLIETEKRKLFFYEISYIIFDAQSMHILIRDLLNLYANHNLTDLKLQFKDFAIWQNKLVKSGMLAKQCEYWLDVYSDGIPKLNLPLDLKYLDLTQRNVDFSGIRYDFAVSKKLTEQLHALANQTNTTLNMILLAIYYIFLAKYTKQDDVVIGTMTAGREHEDLQNIVGHFVNILAIRNSPNGLKPFSEFLNEVKASSLQAYENNDYPFEMLIESLQIAKKAADTHGLDALFTYHNMNYLQQDIKQGEKIASNQSLSFKSFLLPLGSVTEDLFLMAIESPQRLNFQFRYKQALFKAKTIRKMADNYLLILKQIIINPEIQIAKIKTNQNKYLHYVKGFLAN